MPLRSPFVRKILNRIDKLDRPSIRSYFLDLSRENLIDQEILNQLNEGVLLVNAEGVIRFINSQAASWLGLNINVDSRLPLKDLIPDRSFSKFISGHLPGLKDKTISDIDLLSPREMRMRVSLVPLENSKTKDILILLLDITSESSGTDRSSNQDSLVSLAAGIAHEIGNPLNAIAIHLELLKKEIKTFAGSKRQVLEKMLSVLYSETSRLDKIIRNFLKATRKPPLRFQSEDLNHILEDAIAFMQPELEGRRVKVHFQPDSNLPSFLLDRERLYQAFLNLIKNSMEAMPKGGRLWITSSYQNKVAILAFKDEGSGIPEKDLPHIFEAYYTTKEEGTGLGLITVFNAVREHGGRIEVASKVGKGTTFNLLLPIRQPKLQLPQYKSK